MSLNQQSNPAFRWDDTGTYEVLGIMARQQCKLLANQKTINTFGRESRKQSVQIKPKNKGQSLLRLGFLRPNAKR